MRRFAISNVIALAWSKRELLAILQFHVQFPAEAKQNMPLGAPMIGLITGRVFDHADTDIAEVASPPGCETSFSRMLGGRNLVPVSSRHR